MRFLNFKSSFWLVFIVFLFFECSPKTNPPDNSDSTTPDPPTLNPPNNKIFLRDFGGFPNDGQIDTEAFKNALEYLAVEGGILMLENGKYVIDKKIWVRNMSANIAILGQSNTEILVPEDGAFILIAKTRNLELMNSVQSGERQLSVQSIDSINIGDVVCLKSSTPWETGWNYRESDTHIIRNLREGKITLKDSLIFNYDPSEETVNLLVRKRSSVLLKNILFSVKSEDSWAKSTVFKIEGLFVEIENVRIKDQYDRKFHRGFSLVNCPQVKLNNLYFENLEYGCLMNYCRNIEAMNIEAKSSRHALTPANACINMYASDINGLKCQGVIDAHQCFNIHYNNVKDIQAIEYSNCRALGVKITNSYFEIDDSYYADYAYWSNQLLTDEYKHWYKEHDIYFENVNWVANRPSNYNGLTAYSCRNFTVKNCKTHNVSIYGILHGRANIVNSEIGTIRIRSFNVRVDSVRMNGDLFKNANYVLRFAGSGDCVIEDTEIMNYYENRTYLFGDFYNSNSNSVHIINHHIQQLKGFTDRFIYPNNFGYNSFRVNNNPIMIRDSNVMSLISNVLD